MGLSDKIEAFIIELMRDEEDFTEFGRNEIANIFGCVPSQINYVISTRFSPERGYFVESRRGGGGYIRIKRVDMSSCGDVILSIGEKCSYDMAVRLISYLSENGKLSGNEAKLLMTAVSDVSLRNCNNRDFVRADILKNTIMNFN